MAYIAAYQIVNSSSADHRPKGTMFAALTKAHFQVA